MLVRQARRLSSTGRLSCFTRYNNRVVGSFDSNHKRFFQTTSNHDSLIVTGSGVAGCAAAMVAAHYYQIPVKLLFAGNVAHDCNSYWAQGGIIYKNPAEGDSPQLLMEDIVRAGAGLCRMEAVHKVATEGPTIVEELLLNSKNKSFANVPFDRNPNDNSLKCCLEASHAAPRIIHYKDHTGKVITQHLTEAAARHPLIELVPHTLVTDVLVSSENKCMGVSTLNTETGLVENMYTHRGTVLANGGLAGIYQHSTNPSGFNALGSSVGLAERISVSTSDLEYVQFHPTSLNLKGEARFLLTEALRGEGAILRNASGKAFAREFHVDGELAPRDVVARGVFEESQVTGEKVYLDISHRDAQWLYDRFPSIHAHLSQRGLDMARDWIPVIPAAHYTCGGIETNLNGSTSLQGLYAAGEAARTGLHGGNRLASTSLLEGLVFGSAVAHHVGSSERGLQHYETMREKNSSVESVMEEQQQHKTTNSKNGATANTTAAVVNRRATALLSEVRKVMWDHVGVVRTKIGLQTAMAELEELRQEANGLFESHASQPTVALRDATWAGLAVTKAALANPVSAGAHCIVNDEEEDEELVVAAGVN